MSHVSPLSSFSAAELRAVLPHAPPILMIDRILLCQPQRLSALKLVAQNEPFLEGHFPRYPIFPGVLIIESLCQVCGLLFNLERAARAEPGAAETLQSLCLQWPVLVESKIKHIEGVYPGNALRLDAQLISWEELRATFRVSASVEKIEVGKGQLVLRPDAGTP